MTALLLALLLSQTPAKTKVQQATTPWVTSDAHTTAAAPLSCRLTDGASFYTASGGGSVSVSNFPASQAVTGTFWQSTQPVSGPLTDTQLRASAVPVSGSVSVSNLPATQTVSGTVAVSNLPATQPVSGTVAVSNLPATQAVSLATAPTTTIAGQDSSGAQRTPQVDSNGVQSVTVVRPAPPLNPFLQRCNPVRRTNCQP